MRRPIALATAFAFSCVQAYAAAPAPSPSAPANGTGQSITLLNGTATTIDKALDQNQRGRVIISNRNAPPGISSNNNTNYQAISRTLRYSPTGARDLQVCYAGWHMGPAEFSLAPANFIALSATVTAGGSGYVANDIITEALTGGVHAMKLRVLAVSSGAVTKAAIEDPGIYTTLLADGTAQSSTTGAGTGATFAFNWSSFATHVRNSIEPTASQATTGPNAMRPVTWGLGQTGANTGATSNVTLAPALDAEVPPGKLICSDPIPVTIPVGGTFAERPWSNGIGTSFGINVGAGGDNCGFGSPTAPDLSQSGTIAASGTVGNPCFGSALIIGTPIKPMPGIGIIGDSIEWATNGTGTDSGDAAGNKGWAERAVGPQFPIVNMASPSNQIAYLFNASYGRRGQMNMLSVSGVSTVGSFLGVNDMRSGGGNIGEDQVFAYEQQLMAEVRGLRGVLRTFTATSTPNDTSAAATTADASCQRVGGTTTWVNSGLQSRNQLLRVGLIPWNGTAGGTYAAPAAFTATTAVAATGSAAVTPDAMSKASGGATFAVVPGDIVTMEPGTANAETVTVASATGTTFTAPFTKTHAAGSAMSVQSGYYGVYDFVVDFGTQIESAIGSCLWLSSSLTGDGLHPSNAGHILMGSIAAPIIAANAK